MRLIVIALASIFLSPLALAQGPELCLQASDGSYKTAKGEPCYSGARPAATQAPGAAAQRPEALALGKPAQWRVELRDVNIAATLLRWAAEAEALTGVAWRVRWDANKHILVEAPDTFSGTFDEAVTALLSTPGIQASRHPLSVCFYPNTPKLARVTLRGEQDGECK